MSEPYEAPRYRIATLLTPQACGFPVCDEWGGNEHRCGVLTSKAFTDAANPGDPQSPRCNRHMPKGAQHVEIAPRKASSEPALLPCPGCHDGGRVVLHLGATAHCQTCGFTAPREAWNRRASYNSLLQAVRRLVELIDLSEALERVGVPDADQTDADRHLNEQFMVVRKLAGL